MVKIYHSIGYRNTSKFKVELIYHKNHCVFILFSETSILFSTGIIVIRTHYFISADDVWRFSVLFEMDSNDLIIGQRIKLIVYASHMSSKNRLVALHFGPIC